MVRVRPPNEQALDRDGNPDRRKNTPGRARTPCARADPAMLPRRNLGLRLAGRGALVALARRRRDLALRCARRCSGLRVRLARRFGARRTAHREIGLQLLEALGADALDVLQLLDRLEGSVRLPIVDDRLRLRGTDPRERDKLVLRCGIDVDRSERDQRTQGKPECQNETFHESSVVIGWMRGQRRYALRVTPAARCPRYADETDPEISRST